MNGIMNETENVLKISDSKRDYFMDMKTKKMQSNANLYRPKYDSKSNKLYKF